SLKKNLLLILLFLVGVFLIVNFGLRWYTHHGEKLILPDFTGQNFAIASEAAEDQSFQLVVTDSVFRVDQGGGMILNQNPEKNARASCRERKMLRVGRAGEMAIVTVS